MSKNIKNTIASRLGDTPNPYDIRVILYVAGLVFQDKEFGVQELDFSEAVEAVEQLFDNMTQKYNPSGIVLPGTGAPTLESVDDILRAGIRPAVQILFDKYVLD